MCEHEDSDEELNDSTEACALDGRCSGKKWCGDQDERVSSSSSSDSFESNSNSGDSSDTKQYPFHDAGFSSGTQGAAHETDSFDESADWSSCESDDAMNMGSDAWFSSVGSTSNKECIERTLSRTAVCSIQSTDGGAGERVVANKRRSHLPLAGAPPGEQGNADKGTPNKGTPAVW